MSLSWTTFIQKPLLFIGYPASCPRKFVKGEWTDQFKCTDGLCILDIFILDGQVDCDPRGIDKSDEGMYNASFAISSMQSLASSLRVKISGSVFTAELSKGLRLNLKLLYWTFKRKSWLSPFMNTGPDSIS